MECMSDWNYSRIYKAYVTYANFSGLGAPNLFASDSWNHVLCVKVDNVFLQLPRHPYMLAS